MFNSIDCGVVLVYSDVFGLEMGFLEGAVIGYTDDYFIDNWIWSCN